MAYETRKRMKQFAKRKKKVKKIKKPRLYISFNKHAVKNKERVELDTEEKLLKHYNSNKALKMRRLIPVLEKRMDPFAANLKAYLVILKIF